MDATVSKTAFLDNFAAWHYDDFMQFRTTAIIIEIIQDLSWRD